MLVYSDYIYFFIFCFSIFVYIFVFNLVAVMNEDILNDDASHFKLARSVLKMASFEFANRQYFNSTFMNLKIVRLVLNLKCKIVVHAVFSVQNEVEMFFYNLAEFVFEYFCESRRILVTFAKFCLNSLFAT